MPFALIRTFMIICLSGSGFGFCCLFRSDFGIPAKTSVFPLIFAVSGLVCSFFACFALACLFLARFYSFRLSTYSLFQMVSGEADGFW